MGSDTLHAIRVITILLSVVKGRQSCSHKINDIYRYVLVDIFDRDVWLIYRSQHAEPHPYTLRKSMVSGSGVKIRFGRNFLLMIVHPADGEYLLLVTIRKYGSFSYTRWGLPSTIAPYMFTDCSIVRMKTRPPHIIA